MFWINTVSYEHVQAGQQGSFTQADHGKAANLRKLDKNDMIVFYSPKTHFRNGSILQKFTAIGEITDDAPYQVKMNPSFKPWRRNMNFWECNHAPIRPLIAKLDFIKDKTHWGFIFRRGLFEIPESDFELIARSMGITKPFM